MSTPRHIALGPLRPQVNAQAWVAPTATLVGSVAVHARASVWYSAVLRGDGDAIAIGESSNIQDGAVIHADPGFPVIVGERVSVGHRAVLHGCRVGDESLVGMGALILNGAVVGEGCLVAAGSVLLEGSRFDPGTLVAGMPATARRPVTEQERAAIVKNARDYVTLSRQHDQALP